MGIRPQDLLSCIIEPALSFLSEAPLISNMSACHLLLGVAAAESELGKYLVQKKGPALGIYMMEGRTHTDIWENYLHSNRPYYHRIHHAYPNVTDSLLIKDLFYATLITRIHFLRVKEALPHYKDVPGMARYWKKYYNTPLGKGTEEHFITNYTRLVKNELEKHTQ